MFARAWLGPALALLNQTDARPPFLDHSPLSFFWSQVSTAEQSMGEDLRDESLSLRVSHLGGLAVDGLGRFPVTLYKDQWLKLLDIADDIRAFIKANDNRLKTKAAAEP
jgi:hypothetical protein